MLNIKSSFYLNERPTMYRVLAQGVPKGIDPLSFISMLRQFMLEVFDNFSWLGKGEYVLIKVPVNSPDPFPATGHALAIAVASDLIRAKDGIPIVGDQSGIEFVLHSPKGKVRGSTLRCFYKAGLMLDNVRYVAFEEDDWESFDHFRDPRIENWPDGFHVTSWIKKVHHIIALPRIAAHMQTGVTLDAKNYFGFVRQDDRVLAHAQGPLNFVVTEAAEGSELSAERIPGLDFIKMLTEVELAAIEKLRGTVFVGTKVQTTKGPNKYAVRKYNMELGKAYVMEPDIGLLIGSRLNPVACSAVALALLEHCYSLTPCHEKVSEKLLAICNRHFRELGTYSPWDNTFISHGLHLGLGRRIDPDSPDELRITGAPSLDQTIRRLLH